MNIIYASDENFAMVLGVSIASLLQSNANVPILNLYVIDGGICFQSKEKLRDLAQQFNRKIHFLTIDSLDSYTGMPVSCQHKISLTAYYRLFLPQIAPGLEKAIYID